MTCSVTGGRAEGLSITSAVFWRITMKLYKLRLIPIKYDYLCDKNKWYLISEEDKMAPPKQEYTTAALAAAQQAGACLAAPVPSWLGAKITKVTNGFIVKVGCRTLVANTWKEVSKGLELYWEDPTKAEKQYYK